MALAVDHHQLGGFDQDRNRLCPRDPRLVLGELGGRIGYCVVAGGAVDDHRVAGRGAAALDRDVDQRAGRRARIIEVNHVVAGLGVNHQVVLVGKLDGLELIDRDQVPSGVVGTLCVVDGIVGVGAVDRQRSGHHKIHHRFQVDKVDGH